MCISCQGHYALEGGECIEIEGEVLRSYTKLKLQSEYLNDTMLKHTLYSRNDKYRQV